jgi:hypothetical protein
MSLASYLMHPFLAIGLSVMSFACQQWTISVLTLSAHLYRTWKPTGLNKFVLLHGLPTRPSGFFLFGCIKNRLVDKQYETESNLLAQVTNDIEQSSRDARVNFFKIWINCVDICTRRNGNCVHWTTILILDANTDPHSMASSPSHYESVQMSETWEFEKFLQRFSPHSIPHCLMSRPNDLLCANTLVRIIFYQLQLLDVREIGHVSEKSNRTETIANLSAYISPKFMSYLEYCDQKRIIHLPLSCRSRRGLSYSPDNLSDLLW